MSKISTLFESSSSAVYYRKINGESEKGTGLFASKDAQASQRLFTVPSNLKIGKSAVVTYVPLFYFKS
jgi:hypothetical protein